MSYEYKRGKKNHPGKKPEMVHVYNKNVNKKEETNGVAGSLKLLQQPFTLPTIFL
jgi:hypothetical protein